MPVIHLVGPNAIGKTTAVRRWGLRYQQLKAVSFDLLRKTGYNTQEEKVARCAEYRESDQVVVVESARTTQLMCISCDTGGHGAQLVNGDWVPTKEDWKGDKLNRQKLLTELRQSSPVAVVESARTTTTTSYALPDDPVIIVVCPGILLGRNLRLRCEGKSKKFREDYWSADKLEYEASRRYLNFASKRLRPEQYKVFIIEKYERDWAAVDEYFGRVFRKLNNQLNRQRG